MDKWKQPTTSGNNWAGEDERLKLKSSPDVETNISNDRKRIRNPDEDTTKESKRSLTFDRDNSVEPIKKVCPAKIKIESGVVTTREGTTSSEDSCYIAQLKLDFERKQEEKKNQKKDKISESYWDIKRRLMNQPFPCNTLTYTCMSEHCGRTFASLEVLAFHISYSHQIVSTYEFIPSMCLLCGSRWPTTKQRITHLTSKHRLIGEEHNDQCLQQACPVIAPNAPKALRLKRTSDLLEMQAAEQAFEEGASFVYNNESGEHGVPFYD